jgi:carboxyl-terminal processing protease
MVRHSQILCCIASLIFFILFFDAGSFAQGTLKSNRDLMRGIAEGVHDIVKKNFYDASLKGIDWDKELHDAQKKIDASNSPGEMLAAIYWMVRKMDDSHTRFIPPWQTLQPRFGFQTKPFGDIVRVYKVKEKGPAEKAGLLVGDTVLGIMGVIADRKNYRETQFYYRFIQPAAVLVLDIERNGKRQRLEIPADVHTRYAMEEVQDFSRVFDFIREGETDYAENPFESAAAEGIGYVKLRNFIGSQVLRPKWRTLEDMAERSLWKVKGSHALIIDVRGNPGGELEDLQRFAGYLEKSDTELFTETRRKKTEKITAKPRQPSFSDVPIAVLVDSESASSSEVLARHLQLSGRAVIIGDKTAGAVAGAEFFQQHIGTEAAVFYGAQTTVAHAVFPDGKDIEKIGVTPDLMCVPEAADLVAKRDPCYDLAITTLKAKLAAGTSAQK